MIKFSTVRNLGRTTKNDMVESRKIVERCREKVRVKLSFHDMDIGKVSSEGYTPPTF